ncbi:MAG: flagellar hook basal-body protein [Caldilineaceae bacterium]|nr:flagellar hook basal-body protein [Caldilineaceae bacterium]
MPASLNQLWNVAGSGVHSQQRAMEVLSNNIANNNTVGFKASQSRFQAVIREVTLNEDDAGLFVTAQAGDVIQEGMGTLLTETTHIFSQGTMQRTEQPFHMAISGDGFFQVVNGDGQVRYTRAGDFRQDADGRLVNSEGHYLTPAITIPADVSETYVDASGRVLGRPAQAGDEPLLLGTIEIAQFDNPDGLINGGQNGFIANDVSGQAQLGAPGEEGRGILLSGFLENSNVDLGREMVTMLRTQRTYSLSLRALNLADQIHGMANELPRT